jgi:hypothetical protein
MATTELVSVGRAALWRPLLLGHNQPPSPEVDRRRRAASLPESGKSHRRKDKAEHGPSPSAGKIDAANLHQRVRHVGDAGHRKRRHFAPDIRTYPVADGKHQIPSDSPQDHLDGELAALERLV